jgi:hypothetical protein
MSGNTLLSPREAAPSNPASASDAVSSNGPDCSLLADRDVSRKQRHTARRVWQRLAAEHGSMLAEATVSRYVVRRRRELGLDRVDVAVPQIHLPGAKGEGDFGEFYTTIAGVRLKLWMFVMRLSHSGRAFHVAFAIQAQEAFLAGSRAGVSALRRGAGTDPQVEAGFTAAEFARQVRAATAG